MATGACAVASPDARRRTCGRALDVGPRGRPLGGIVVRISRLRRASPRSQRRDRVGARASARLHRRAGRGGVRRRPGRDRAADSRLRPLPRPWHGRCRGSARGRVHRLRHIRLTGRSRTHLPPQGPARHRGAKGGLPLPPARPVGHAHRGGATSRRGRSSRSDAGRPAGQVGDRPTRPHDRGSHGRRPGPDRRRRRLHKGGGPRHRRACPPGAGGLPGRAAHRDPPRGPRRRPSGDLQPAGRPGDVPRPGPAAHLHEPLPRRAPRHGARDRRGSARGDHRDRIPPLRHNRRARHLRPALPRRLPALPEPRGDARACTARGVRRRGGGTQVVRERPRRPVRGRARPRHRGSRDRVRPITCRGRSTARGRGRTT